MTDRLLLLPALKPKLLSVTVPVRNCLTRTFCYISGRMLTCLRAGVRSAGPVSVYPMAKAKALCRVVSTDAKKAVLIIPSFAGVVNTFSVNFRQNNVGGQTQSRRHMPAYGTIFLLYIFLTHAERVRASASREPARSGSRRKKTRAHRTLPRGTTAEFFL